MRPIIAYAVLAPVSFLLHLLWERAHIVLYTNYEALEGVLPVYVFAAFGDVFYTFLAIFTIALVRRDIAWIYAVRAREHAMLAVVGLAIAVFVEAKARVYARWEYTDMMPTLWGFGLSPLIQMTVLLPLSVFITMVVVRFFNR